MEIKVPSGKFRRQGVSIRRDFEISIRRKAGVSIRREGIEVRRSSGTSIKRNRIIPCGWDVTP